MPQAAKDEGKIGQYAFLGGLVLVLLVGMAALLPAIQPYLGLIYGILGILGLIVGFLNITEKEINSFLLAAIALMMVSGSLQPIVLLFNIAAIGDFITALLQALAVFVAPAALVVAVLAIYKLAQPG
jgi:hypothetical protein